MRPVKQGDLSLLQEPAAQLLLQSTIPARLAYVGTDGSPRVVPIWFHWNGREIVMASPPNAPKLKALAKNPKVALTIDENDFPQKVSWSAERLGWRRWTESCPNMKPAPRATSTRNRREPGWGSFASSFQRWCGLP